MKLSSKLGSLVALSCLAIQTAALAAGHSPKEWIKPYRRGPLQDIVTWDEHSLFVHGERVVIYSGEVHPFRLPVPGLYHDLFQKIKGLGLNCVSFYVDWALLEGQPGEYRAEGVFDLKPFFEAASRNGIYLIARPGPYINAEVSGGGFPGWMQRIEGRLRTRAHDYLNATDNYVKQLGATLAAAQITHGGPIILVQPENEYSEANKHVKPFPDPVYMQYVEDQLRNAGIVVPLINNDSKNGGKNAPGTPAAVDIYSHDGYPLGFNCEHPTDWPNNGLPTDWLRVHLQQSPSTPYSIAEFQGGSYDPWGGSGFDNCAVLVGVPFQKVFYKQLYSFGVKILNLYMLFGGTNWGNLGHPGGYTSYDYAAPIGEDLRVNREKYSDLKLQANFIKASPAYLTATALNDRHKVIFSGAGLIVVASASGNTKFYFVRHAQYTTLKSTQYHITLSTKEFGKVRVPQYKGTYLSLNGRDSKIHVSDYDLGGTTLVYSTAEIFTWHKYQDRTVLVVHGGKGETHELMLAATGLEFLEGDFEYITKPDSTLLNFQTDGGRKVAKVGTGSNSIYVYMLDQNEAYNYWSVDQAPHNSSDPIIVKAGYLVRSAKVDGTTLALTGDVNATTPIEVVGGAPSSLSKLMFNGDEVDFKVSKEGVPSAVIGFREPHIALPSLKDLSWKYMDSLPETQSSYDDSKWTKANLNTTYNSHRRLNTVTSLYGSDYGYHTGSLIYRGTFTATGDESEFWIVTQGGSAYGSSTWIGGYFLGSWRGDNSHDHGKNKFSLPKLSAGKSYTFVVIIDMMGYEENWHVGVDKMKKPRGIMDFHLAGHAQSDVAWKLTGNLGGESYVDISRGPLNEGAFAAERRGFHLPGALAASTAGWQSSKGPVVDGLAGPGIGFFATEFSLNMPSGYDVPLSFILPDAIGSSVPAYRVQLYVNGWQYGKYVSNVGPQFKFPVPEGILNYRGSNYLALSLWNLDGAAVKLDRLELNIETVAWSGRGKVHAVKGVKYSERAGAY